MPNTSNVATGKPRVGGAVFRAPKGTTLPKSAVETLATAFKDMGYISEDGLTNAYSLTSENKKAWGGDVVLVSQTGVEDKVSMTLIEPLNIEVLKAVYGDDNVSGDLTTGIVVKVNSDDKEEYVWVFDMILNGAKKRLVLPSAILSEVGEIAYKDSDMVGYAVTLTALPDADGQTHYEYITSQKQEKTSDKDE
jgi:hypothetical protein